MGTRATIRTASGRWHETIAFIERYATLVSPPLRTHCPVTSVRSTGDGYQVVTEQGTWHCKAVVLATGAFNIAQVPKLSEEIPSGIAQLTTAQYRNPEEPRAGRRHGRRCGRLRCADR